MKVCIGCQVDHDMKQYTFTRRSGLPWNYYKRRSPDWWVVFASVCLGLVALLVAL